MTKLKYWQASWCATLTDDNGNYIKEIEMAKSKRKPRGVFIGDPLDLNRLCPRSFICSASARNRRGLPKRCAVSREVDV